METYSSGICRLDGQMEKYFNIHSMRERRFWRRVKEGSHIQVPWLAIGEGEEKGREEFCVHLEHSLGFKYVCFNKWALIF